MVDDSRIRGHVQRLLDAHAGVKPVAGPSAAGDALSEEEAFAVQAAVAEARAEDGHSRVCGYKAGLGPDPLTGRVLHRDMVLHGGNVPFSALIAPKIEPEVAFVMGDRLGGNQLTITDVLRATDFVVPAFEIVDSRLEAGFASPRTDLIADNGAFARAVLGGSPVRPDQVDLAHVAVELEENGRLVAAGRSNTATAHPAHAVMFVAGLLHKIGLALEPGDFVLSGSCTTPFVASADTALSARFQGIGSVEVAFS